MVGAQDSKYQPGELERHEPPNIDRDARPVRLAIIGCGARGIRLAAAADAVGQSVIGGAFDPYSDLGVFQRRVKRLDRFRAYGSLSEACADSDIDGLIVATPAHVHLETMRECASCGKAILLDKPIAHTIEDSRAIADLLRGHAGIFYMGLQYRMKPVYQETFRLLGQGSVGSIKTIYIREHRPPYLDKWRQWNKFSKFSGGAMVEKCCHYFDLFNVAAGSRPKKVYCAGGMDVNFVDFEQDGERADVIDNSFTIVEFENGVRACLNFCMFAYQPDVQEMMIVNGDKGGLYAFDHPQHRIRISANSPHESPREIHLEVKKQIESSGHSGADYYEILNFIAAIRRRSPAPLPTVEDGVWAVAAGVAAERSIRSGEPVYLKDVFEQSGANAFGASGV